MKKDRGVIDLSRLAMPKAPADVFDHIGKARTVPAALALAVAFGQPLAH